MLRVMDTGDISLLCIKASEQVISQRQMTRRRSRRRIFQIQQPQLACSQTRRMPAIALLYAQAQLPGQLRPRAASGSSPHTAGPFPRQRVETMLGCQADALSRWQQSLWQQCCMLLEVLSGVAVTPSLRLHCAGQQA